MNTYKRFPKRERDAPDPVIHMQCQFPVGNAKLLELYAKNVEVKSWIRIELPGLWEETTAAKPWFKNAIGKTLRARRRLQPEDTAVLLLEIPLHDESDTEFTEKMITSIKTIVDELQTFVKNDGERNMIFLILDAGHYWNWLNRNKDVIILKNVIFVNNIKG